MPYLLAISAADLPCSMAQVTCLPSRISDPIASTRARNALGDGAASVCAGLMEGRAARVDRSSLRTVAGGVGRGRTRVSGVGGVERRGDCVIGGGAATAKVVMTCLPLNEGGEQ